jgi:hypothetical protein
MRPACVATARRIDRAFHGGVGGAPQVASAKAGEGHPLPGKRGWQNAIEHVDTAVYRLEQISRGADSHQIARPVLGQQLGHDGRAVFALCAALADRKAANGKAVERHLRNGARALGAQVRVTGTLGDAEQGLRRVASGREAPLRPAMRQVHRAGGDAALDGRGHTLIKRHQDVRPDGSLRLDAAFRAQPNEGIVDIAFEFGVFLAQRAASRQREYLIAAGIGQNRSRPVHEGVDPVEFFEDCNARPQHQMIGVGEEDLGAALEQVFTPLRTHGCVRAHGHEGRRQDFVVTRRETRRTRARAGGRGFEFEGKPPHGGTVT